MEPRRFERRYSLTRFKLVRKCSRCEENWLTSRSKTGLCRRCYTTENRHKYKPTKSKNREISQRKKYGLEPGDYEKILESQGGVCAIKSCDSSTQLRIDHDHITGVVRGILCHVHNVGLGYFGDSIEGLEEAVAYLSGEKITLDR